MSSETSKTEPLFVLYGSQMGNSEQAAQDFCSLLQERLSPSFFKSHGLPTLSVETTCIQLDDFLEIHHAAFTKCLVIFVSSYGVGQAPLGAYRFREVCESWGEDKNTDTLKGLSYALCGLGDSSYPTYLKNPKTIDAGLKAAGASRIGDMGTADASAMGDQAQDKVIARWTAQIWLPLAKTLAADSDEVDVKAMQAKTIPLLVKLDPDYSPPKETKKGGGLFGFLGFTSVVLAVASAAVALVMRS